MQFIISDSTCSYYALAAACVFARKEEWIRNPCLAAVLLFPAVAALHGIVLAALHRNGEFLDLHVGGYISVFISGNNSSLSQEPWIWMSMVLFNYARSVS